MTEKMMGSLDSVTSGSTTEGCAEKTDAAPKLDLQAEIERRQEGAPIASDAPRRVRKLRVAAVIAGLLVVLGIGWGAGLKTSELVKVGDVYIWFQDVVGALASNIDTQRKKVIAKIEGLTNTSVSQQANSSEGVPDDIKSAEIIERKANELSSKIDELRASSATAVGELSRGIERVNETVERSRQELLAKLDNLRERLERVERHASAIRQVQPLEQPAATKPAPLPLQPSAPPMTSGSAKPAAASTATKRIENWAVTDVVDGTAILTGPNGIVGVSSGDVVPGVGRVESIVRRRGQWVVATSKGVITGR